MSVSVFETLQESIHAIARAAVQEITRAVTQEGQSEVPFTAMEIRAAVRSLPAEQRTTLCRCLGVRGIQFLLTTILWEDFGLTMGRKHGGVITVRGARQGTLAAELRRQLQQKRRH
jgi:hypothetical protein